MHQIFYSHCKVQAETRVTQEPGYDNCKSVELIVNMKFNVLKSCRFITARKGPSLKQQKLISFSQRSWINMQFFYIHSPWGDEINLGRFKRVTQRWKKRQLFMFIFALFYQIYVIHLVVCSILILSSWLNGINKQAHDVIIAAEASKNLLPVFGCVTSLV